MTNYLPFLTFIFIGAFTPGPNNCMALSHAARGLRNGVTFSVGVFGGMLVTMLACGLLSGFLAQHLDSAALFMKIIGCAYMVWLAWRLWKSSGVNDGPVQGQRKLLLTGCALQLVNPKLIAYGITAFSVFILPSFSEVTILVWFAVLLAVVGFAGTLTGAFCGAGLKRIFQAHPTLINRVLAVMVLGCAVSIIV
ncbi:MAG: LysE family transporter [Deltaproteobacteria bacterium]|jgi:threonine/homoserine/homoserine lactone efflux protein|nr:LysE family transporter [Deltaproteobacteria bacterium]